jgi:AcrR family transcriptional regulator
MAESTALQDIIVEKAGELFRKQGYTSTTIKQIAKASGCTTAALYYYFEGGKQQILREVIRRPDEDADLPSQLPQADSLEEFLVKLGASLDQRFTRVSDRFNWIFLQYPALPDEEKRIVQSQVTGIQKALEERIGQHVADKDAAERLAWLVFCSYLGYQQIFTKLEVGAVTDLGMDEYSAFLARVVDSGLE